MAELDFLGAGQLATENFLKRGQLTSPSWGKLYDLKYRPDLTWKTDGVHKLPVDTSAVYEIVRAGIGSSSNPLGGLDVYVQDQYTRLIDRFLTHKYQTVTLAQPVELNSRTAVLSSGHGFTDPPASPSVGTPIEMLELNHNGIQYQSRVSGVDGNNITLSNPLCCDIPAGVSGFRTTPDANVNGLIEPVVFSASPPPGTIWDVNILSVNMLDQSAMDDSTFGGIDGPIAGAIYRTINTTVAENIFTAVDNSCYIRHCDVENPYSQKAPSGYYGFNAKRRFNGQQGDGVSRRIGGEFHSFEVTIYGDLRGLDRFWNVIRGHVVE